MNVFELFGTIAINNKGAIKSLDETGKKMQGLLKTTGQVVDHVGKRFQQIGKAVTIVAAAGTAAVGTLMKGAVGAYAEYQQLEGGIKAMFGEDTASKVMFFAKNAYKEVGLSANDYMSTVTSFSSKLIKDLGGDTEAAADVANTAIQDMADNANRMGTDITLIQNAYQGFAKQNYTMLDNLKLGYGGTATEMARLINDSGVMGETFVVTAENLNEVSFAKIIEAIHVMQREMNIAGATAREAEDTLTGSFNAWKAAGSNLLTSIAAGDETSMQEAITAFTETTNVLLANLTPVISAVVTSIGTLLTELLPSIGQQAIDFGADIISKIVSGITGSTITSEDVKTAINGILDVGETALSNTLSFIKDALQWITDNQTFVVTAIGAIAVAFLAFKLVTNPIGTTIDLIIAGLALLVTNWEGVKAAIDGAIRSIRKFLGLSETAEEAQQEYVALAIANEDKTALQRYAGKYSHWTWDQQSAGQDYLYGYHTRDSEMMDTAEAELGGLGLSKEAIEEFKLDVESLLKENDYTLDLEYAMFDASVAAQLQSQLDGMNLTVDVTPTVSGDGEQAPGHASGLRNVPEDNYLARLHMGEMVLPRNEAETYRKGGQGGADLGGLRSLLEEVLAILRQVATNTGSGTNVVLDSGALVGQLTPRIDAQLGMLAARKERRG